MYETVPKITIVIVPRAFKSISWLIDFGVME
jgi:hypothetical protein